MTSAPDRLLRRLEWHVVRRLDGQIQGDYRTVFRGTGIDFSDLREYMPEDDVRHIDWNVTARMDEPYVRQYNQDRDLTAWLVLDRSASMRFGGGSAASDRWHSGGGSAASDRWHSGGGSAASDRWHSGGGGAAPDRLHSGGGGAAPDRRHSGGGSSADSDVLGKDGLLAELAVCLARLFTLAGNRVGAILFDNGYQRVIPPRTGRNHVLRLADEITRAARTPHDGRSTDLDAMLRLAERTARRRGLVFVISDFISDRSSTHGDDERLDWEPALTRLGQRHEVVAVRVVDPAELALPDLGLVLVEDAETGEQLLADTSDPLFQSRLRSEVDAREAAVADAMRRAGVTAHRLGTDQDLLAELIGMVRQSRRRR